MSCYPNTLCSQAVNDAQIGPGGAWYKDYTLIPHGLLYRVQRNMSLSSSGRHHPQSYGILNTLRRGMPTPSESLFRVYDAGTSICLVCMLQNCNSDVTQAAGSSLQ